MLLATESKNSTLFSHLIPAFDVFVMLRLRPSINRKFCIFCCELIASLSISGCEKFTALTLEDRHISQVKLSIWRSSLGLDPLRRILGLAFQCVTAAGLGSLRTLDVRCGCFSRLCYGHAATAAINGGGGRFLSSAHPGSLGLSTRSPTGSFCSGTSTTAHHLWLNTSSSCT